ncbi:MAG: hypothetical protein QNJ77_11880 [Acidimicrobiia bacterium]|nr:hypothetical protein [Acidimicrobiia bacterium]
MPGDPPSRNEDELLSQIDELKARMDRLMKGGTSTSNSALLTDKPVAKPPTAPPASQPPAAPPPAPNRTRVRDLLGPEETEVIETYPGRKEAVPFPEGDTADTAAVEQPPAEESAAAVEPQPEVEPPVAESPAPTDAPVIHVEEDTKEPRPQVASFDDLGSAIQKELAKDGSVPPAEDKKGPDLASRFGPVEETVAADTDTEEADDEPEVPEVEDAEEVVEEEPEFVPVDRGDRYRPRRSARGKVAAIWAVTAIASGAIATLHFIGVI